MKKPPPTHVHASYRRRKPKLPPASPAGVSILQALCAHPSEPAKQEWKPPFAGTDAGNCKCPKCGEGPIQVRDKELYYDGDTNDAYCSSCHAILRVQSTVRAEFHDPEIVE